MTERIPKAVPLMLPHDMADACRRLQPNLLGTPMERYDLPVDLLDAAFLLQVMSATADLTALPLVPRTVRSFVQFLFFWSKSKRSRFELSVKSPRGTATFDIAASGDANAVARAIIDHLFPPDAGDV